jgi:hypothetical protein
MTYLERAKDIYDMMFQGKLLDAFDKYYADNVVMQELGEEPRTGKAINREYEVNFLNSIKEMHGGGITAMAADEENKVVFVENWMDVTMNGPMTGNADVRMKMTQVNVQNWEGDHIVKEVFYHK